MESYILYRTSGNNPALTAIAIDPKGKRIACGTADAEIILIDLKKGRPERVLNGHEGIISGLQFIKDGSRLLTSSWDQTARVWSCSKGQPSPHIVSHNSEFKELTAQEDAGRGAIGARDGLVKVFSLKNLKCLRNLPTHQKDVSGVAITDDGSYLASASYDGGMKLWDMSSYELVKNLLRQKEKVRSLALDGVTNRAYAGLQSGSIRSVLLENARDRTELDGHTDFMGCLSIDPTNRYLASGSWDRTLRIWDLNSCELLTSSICNSEISSVAWHPSGDQIYTTDFTGSLTSWKTDL